MIIGCDLHTRYQQIAMLDTETGEEVERRLEHESGEARAFYSALQGRVRVGIEATGHTHWFEAMLAELRNMGTDGTYPDYFFPIRNCCARKMGNVPSVPGLLRLCLFAARSRTSSDWERRPSWFPVGTGSRDRVGGQILNLFSAQAGGFWGRLSFDFAPTISCIEH